MATHHLKVWPRWYQAIESGTKTFEVRKDDRGYQAGDYLYLQEWSPDPYVSPAEGYAEKPPGFTGRTMSRKVGFIFRQGFGVDLGEYVVMSLLDAS